jgi:hypothetical protein
VGFHIKLHGNTQILISLTATVVQMRQMLTMALTFSLNLGANGDAVGFWELELL